MAAAINSAGLSLTAVATTSGVGVMGVNLSVATGTTPFATITAAGNTCGATAQARPDGSIALYGSKIAFSTMVAGQPATPFVQYGRSGGSYQLQVRLQVQAEIPGSKIQYATIRYATTGIDIQGKPGTSPLVTDLNSIGTNASFDTAQEIGNLLDTSTASISVSGQLANLTDVNWYKFELGYQDIEDIGTSSFPVIFDVNYADGLGRPDTVLWVFDNTGKLMYVSDNSYVVDDQVHLGDDVTNPKATSFGPNDAFLGPVQMIKNDAAPTTYYVAVTGKGVTADALTQTLLRQRADRLDQSRRRGPHRRR